MNTLKIERFKMLVPEGEFSVQREENEHGVYFDIKHLDLSVPDGLPGLQYTAARLYRGDKTAAGTLIKE